MTEVLDQKAIKALSTETRQGIIKELQKRPYTASELSKKLGKHVTTVSEHLTVLESSGLVIKKDSTNKWVYYTLTSKGEKIFKPNFYSFVLVLSLSLLAIIGGTYEITANGFSSMSGKAAFEMNPTQAGSLAAPTTAPAPDVLLTQTQINLIIGIVLVGLGVIGLYWTYRIKKQKENPI